MGIGEIARSLFHSFSMTVLDDAVLDGSLHRGFPGTDQELPAVHVGHAGPAQGVLQFLEGGPAVPGGQGGVTYAFPIGFLDRNGWDRLPLSWLRLDSGVEQDDCSSRQQLGGKEDEKELAWAVRESSCLSLVWDVVPTPAGRCI